MKPFINGIGTAIGSDILDVKKIAVRFGKPLRRVERLGIERLHRYSKDENLTDKAVEAARRAMQMAGITNDKLAGIYACVAAPVEGYLMPGLARIVGQKLGAKRIPMISGGVGCAGGIQMLEAAFHDYMFNASILNQRQNYLVIAGDNTSKVLDKNEWETSPLFSEGASAIVLGHRQERSMFALGSVRTSALDGDIYSMHVVSKDGKPFFRMRGEEVFNFATREAIPEVLRLVGMGELGYCYLIPHQASGLILEHIAGRNNIPNNQIYTDGVKLGNLSCSSVFFGLEDVVKRNLASGKDVVLGAFGAELAVGAAYLEKLK